MVCVWGCDDGVCVGGDDGVCGGVMVCVGV